MNEWSVIVIVLLTFVVAVLLSVRMLADDSVKTPDFLKRIYYMIPRFEFTKQENCKK